jgi:hypothetical protein
MYISSGLFVSGFRKLLIIHINNLHSIIHYLCIFVVPPHVFIKMGVGAKHECDETLYLLNSLENSSKANYFMYMYQIL